MATAAASVRRNPALQHASVVRAHALVLTPIVHGEPSAVVREREVAAQVDEHVTCRRPSAPPR